MGWAGQTWAKIFQEGTGGTDYGVFNASGASLVPTIYGPDAFTVRKVPMRQIIRTADAGNRRKMVVANRYGYVGRFSTLLLPDEAAYWMTAATSLTSNYLPSYSFEFWDSVRATRYLGGMIRSLTITSSAEQDYVTLSTDWIFQTLDDTFSSFTAPTGYSTLTPYYHVESASNITLGGTAITKYKAISLTVNNDLKGTWDEQSHITALYYCGRDLDFQVGPQYLATTYRTDFEGQTALSWVIDWTRASPAHSLSFNLETNAYISNIEDSLPLDGPGYQNLQVQCFYDASNTTDFAVTVS